MRERTGRGQHVDVALLGALTSLRRDRALGHDGAGGDPDGPATSCRASRRSGSSRRATATSRSARRPTRSRAACSRRSAGPSSSRTSASRRATGASRTRRSCTALIARWTATRARREAVAGFDARACPAAVVRDTATAVRDPRALAAQRDGAARAPASSAPSTISTAAASPSASRRRGRARAPPPRLGQHNELVLGGLLGYPHGAHRGASRRRRYLIARRASSVRGRKPETRSGLTAAHDADRVSGYLTNNPRWVKSRCHHPVIPAPGGPGQRTFEEARICRL